MVEAQLPLKVIHYWPHLLFQESSGPGNAILGSCRALARLGVKATVIVDEGAVRIQPPEDIDFVLVKHVGRRLLRVPKELPLAEKDEDLLVTHGGWVLHNIVAGRHASRRGVPYVVNAHGVYHPRVLRRKALLKRAWFLLERPYLDRAAAIHVFFQPEIEHLASLGIRSPVVIAPNGISPPNGVRWDGGSGGHLLWLGRYDPVNKGLDVLLAAMRLLPEAERPRLLLHGRDWHGGRSAVERLVRSLDLGDSVSVGGPIYGHDKWRLMAESAGFLYPSRWEASPTAVAEAVSIGTPTLVADYPLGRLLASHGGALLAELTPSGVRDGIRRLRSAEAREWGERGSEFARRELTWDAVTRSWLEQIRTVLQGVST